MTRRAKVLERLLGGAADAGFRFDELCALLRAMGFSERRSGGSHHIFTRGGIAEILNLQPRGGGEAKAYQVRQVREVVLKYKLFATLLRDRTLPETDDEA